MRLRTKRIHYYRGSFPTTVAPYQFEPYVETADDNNDEETDVQIADEAIGFEYSEIYLECIFSNIVSVKEKLFYSDTQHCTSNSGR